MIHIAGDPSGMFGTIIAVIFFLLVYQRDIQVPLMRKIFTKVSLLSLDVYLCCYIFDAIYYPWFKEHYFINQSQFGMFFFVIVPLVFISSLVLAQIKEWLFKIFKVNHLWVWYIHVLRTIQTFEFLSFPHYMDTVILDWLFGI